MAEDETTPTTRTYAIEVPDAPHLPLIHINALNLRYAVDEFFFTLGVVLPPEVKDTNELASIERLTAEPVFRFAVSRQVMQRFIDLMVTQFNQQTEMIQRLMKESSNG
jgi:hypothetical protein